MDAEFVPVIVPRGSAGPARIGADVRRWMLNSAASLRVEHPAPVTDLSFSPLIPHDLAAASGPSVLIVDPRTAAVRRSIARFRDVAHSPCYKHDGRLLVAGCDNGTVQLFDLASRAILRVFKGHNGAVHSSKFSADGLRVMSGSDDGVVRSWDLATSKHLFSLRGATDYVRAQAASPVSKHIWAAGSYDRHARVYDMRTRKILFTLEHGSQIDEMILLPGGARAVTIGGTNIKVWDFFAGGRMVANLQSHAKAVTCGALSADGDYLLTGGLDGYVKVHDLSKLEVLSSMPFDSQILSLAVAPNGRRVAVGLVDGTIEFRSKKERMVSETMESSSFGRSTALTPTSGVLKERLFEGWGRGFKKLKRKKGPNPGSLHYFLRGSKGGPTDDRDIVIAKRKRVRLARHDVLLRKFSYSEALDAVLAAPRRKTIITHSLLVELVARNGLRAALAGRDSASLAPVLSVVCKNMCRSQYSPVLVQVAELVLEMYGDMFGGECSKNTVDGLLQTLRENVKAEIAMIHELCGVQGMLEIVGTASARLPGR